ncbi:MAG: prepilin-type N-terminal cleavage/methylation domain-containing protein [Candidatus Omnitrophica bacterium]|nr:prepilin-type N-terminal cleavage/methylation domain-containing protein [Candidatus Omnitrophota bacterium]
MLRSKRRAKKRGGFLLLEVLVSITVISVGLVFIVRSFSSTTRAIETSGRLLKSVFLLEEKLWQFEAEGVIEKGTDRGPFEEEEGYSWEVRAADAKEAPLNRVNLKVEWEGVRRKQRVSVDTYLWNDEG